MYGGSLGGYTRFLAAVSVRRGAAGELAGSGRFGEELTILPKAAKNTVDDQSPALPIFKEHTITPIV